MSTLSTSTPSEPESAAALQALLRTWRRGREVRKAQSKAQREQRAALSTAQRAKVLGKTDGRCHICGGPIIGTWQADHVLAHSGGGRHAEDNYLPAHPLCNNYRWDYSAEEFQYILKLGVWARTQVETNTRLGGMIAQNFVAYERRRLSRRRQPTTDRATKPAV